MSPLEGFWGYGTADGRRTEQTIERDIDDELEHHLALASQDLVRAGMEPEAARAEAERRFGDRQRLHETCRNILIGERIMLRRLHLAFTAVLILTVFCLAWQSLASREATLVALDQAMAEHAALASWKSEATQRERAPQSVVVALGDTIALSSGLHEDLATQALVVRDGTVLLPHVGHVSVFGLTRDEVEQRLAALYAPLYELVDVRVQVLAPQELSAPGVRD